MPLVRALAAWLLRRFGTSWLQLEEPEDPTALIDATLSRAGIAWKGAEGRDFVSLKRVRTLLAERRARPAFGNFGRKGGSAGALILFDCWLLAHELAGKRSSGGPPHLALVLWDSDRQPAERREGLAQGKAQILSLDDGERPRLVAGLAVPEGEAWKIAAFQPLSELERERLARARVETGLGLEFDLHKLTSAREDGLRDAKRIARLLGLEELGRAHAALLGADPRRLAARGKSIGLLDFLRALLEHLRKHEPALLDPAHLAKDPYELLSP